MLYYSTALMLWLISLALIILSLILVVFLLDVRVVVARKYKPKTTTEHVKALMRQAYRWYIASVQDNHPLIKLLHANYAMGYIMAIDDIADNETVYAITGLDIRELSKEVKEEQDSSMVLMSQMCPDLMPKSQTYKKYLSQLHTLQ